MVFMIILAISLTVNTIITKKYYYIFLIIGLLINCFEIFINLVFLIDINVYLFELRSLMYILFFLFFALEVRK